MRKSILAPLVALIALTLSAGAVLGVTVFSIQRQCIDDTGGQRFITGSVTVVDGSFATGDVLTLTLFGKIGSAETSLQTETIPLTEGTLTYDFTFENVPTTNGSTLYTSYIIRTDADNPEKSESIDVEVECRPGVIPEAPLVVLLLVTAGVLTTWFVIRRTRPTASGTPMAA